MSRVGAVLLCLVVAGCATTRQSNARDDEPRLVELNRTLFERLLLHRDPGPYHEIAFPEYLFVANIGIVENKQEVVSTPENLAIESLTIANERVVIRGDTAVLVGLMTVRGTVLGFPLPEQMRYMSVFVRADGGWRLLAESLTPFVDPRKP